MHTVAHPPANLAHGIRYQDIKMQYVPENGLQI